MGRTEKSQGLAPPAVRKDIRAKQARQIINKTIPALIASNARARKGLESSEAILDPGPDARVRNTSELDNSEDAGYIKRKGQGRRKIKTEFQVEVGVDHGNGKGRGRKRQDSVDYDLANLNSSDANTNLPRTQRKVRIFSTDTLTVAHVLACPSKYGIHEQKSSKRGPNVCVLNMASPLRPGGGVLTGATSQEEFLCARTTLLPSLKESFYRLPELGGIWSPDVLVFRDSLPLGDAKGELGPGDRYWIDVISAGMLRFPELEGEDDQVKRLSKSDSAIVENKMRAVLRIAAHKGVKKLVLGAWGCGAYGNPVRDIAQAWKKVLDSPPSSSSRKPKATAHPETWPHLEEVVFAITNRKMAASFAHAFDTTIDLESMPDNTSGHDTTDDDDEEDAVAAELRTKIHEIQNQASQARNPDLKARMRTILEGLEAQLREREAHIGTPESGSIDGDLDDRWTGNMLHLPCGDSDSDSEVGSVVCGEDGSGKDEEEGGGEESDDDDDEV